MAHSEAFYKKPEECHYSFFQHKECEFFPCHKTDHPKDFNCLFCYCPLFALGKECKGNFRIPHTRKSYSYIISRFSELMEVAKEQDWKEDQKD